MLIGVPKEIKTQEYRVAVTPFGVEELRRDGHTILVEPRAGEGSGFSDDEYLKAGAEIIDRETLFKKADLIVKVGSSGFMVGFFIDAIKSSPN